MSRILHIILEDCSNCSYNKWQFSKCGKFDGPHCTHPGMEENTSIVADDELTMSGGKYPPIPDYCPLPNNEGVISV